MSHMSRRLVLDEPNQSQDMILQSTTKPLKPKSQLFTHINDSKLPC